MKEFNLIRLMNSCCVDIDLEVYDALFDYLMEMDVDLNTLNIDDLYVNGVSFIPEEEFDIEQHYLLTRTDDGCWII